MAYLSFVSAAWRRGTGQGLALLLLAAAPLFAQAQTGGVGIGITTPAASAALDVTSTTRGLLPPRMSQAQRDAIAAPATGLTLYNTTTNKVNTWNGTSWDAALSATEQPFQNPTQTFAYTGGVQTYTVPANVTSVLVDARGASGDGCLNATGGGLGARVQATLSVVPGQVLQVRVGGAGDNNVIGGSSGGGYNGGGAAAARGGSGGGATDVRSSGGALADRLLVAAGGGGGGYVSYGTQGGAGGYPTGGNGTDLNGDVTATGGSQTAGGSTGGTLGTGGSGYPGGNSDSGGGGGGYYGGGGGSPTSSGGGIGGGGGGGCSFVISTGSNGITHTAGANAGNGTLIITPAPAYAAPLLNGANFVNVPGTWQVSGADVYRATGRVGIGTGSPVYPLTVQANATGLALGFNNNAGTDRYNFSLGSTGLNLSQSNVAGGRLFVQDGGHVGIGTTTPNARLHVAGVALVEGGGPPTASSGTGIGWNAAYPGRNESEFYNYRGAAGAGNGGFRFFCVPGTAAPTAGNQVAQINGSTGVYATLSDRRVKTNIAPLSQGLRTVLALRPVSYDFHPSRRLEADGQVTFLADDRPVRALGFVAQELLPLVPEAVERPADERTGFYAVSYATLVPVLTQAIQEQQAQIEALKQQNAALQARAASAEAKAATAETKATQATATLETFEARLRRLEAAGGQAQR